MDVESFITGIYESKKLIEHIEKGVLFFGNTGMGKSTLLHLILKNPDLYIDQTQDGDFVYRINEKSSNELAKIKIGEGVQSATSIPITIMRNNIGYRDLPGFMDNRVKGQNFESQDFKNSFHYSEIFQKTQYLKLIIVVNASHIQGRATQFTEVIRNFKERFGSFSGIKKSILIIFNMHRDGKIEPKINKLIQFLKKNNQIDEAQFLQQVINQKNFVVLPKLKQIGQVDFKMSKQIHQKIQRLKWQKNDFPQKIIISDKTKSILGDNRKNMIEQMNQTMKKYCKEISSDLKVMYDKGKKSQLLIQMQKMKECIESLSIKTDRVLIFKDLKNYFKKHSNFLELLDQFEDTLNFLDFISQTNCQKSFYQIEDILKIIRSSIQVNINAETKIILLDQSYGAHVTTKKIITSNQMQKIIDANLEFNYFVFFIQEVNMNSNIVAHGKNLLLFTKILKTSKSNKLLIDLSGKNAEEIYQLAQDENGRPGYNGQNGGSLYLKVDQFVGDLIHVELSGGNGGNGQNCRIQNLQKYIPNFHHGKIFQQDCKKQDTDKVFLLKRQPYGYKDKQGWEAFTHVLKGFTTFNGQVLETYQTATLKAWNKYYKLVPGGGGHPGYAGKVIHFNTNSKDEFNLKDRIFPIIKEKKRGFQGILILDKYQGIFQRELVFCGARKQGLSYKQQTMMDFLEKQILLGGLAVGGKIIFTQMAKQAVQQATKKTLIYTGKKMISQKLAQQAIKTATLQAAQTIGTSGMLGGLASFGVGLAIQGALSPIVASFSDEWKQYPKFIDKVRMAIPVVNRAFDVEKTKELSNEQKKALLENYQKLNFDQNPLLLSSQNIQKQCSKKQSLSYFY